MMSIDQLIDGYLFYSAQIESFKSLRRKKINDNQFVLAIDYHLTFLFFRDLMEEIGNKVNKYSLEDQEYFWYEVSL